MCTSGEPAVLSGGVPARISARLARARLRTKSRGVETKVFRPAVLLAETGEGMGTARGGIRRLAAGTDLRNRGKHPVDVEIIAVDVVQVQKAYCVIYAPSKEVTVA